LIVQLISVIIVLEVVDFILSYILPKKRMKGAYENAINMIIFSFIIVICINIFTTGDFSLFSLGDLIKTQDVKTYEFDEYVKIYRELIFNALE